MFLGSEAIVSFMGPLPTGSWSPVTTTHAFQCGFCGNKIATDKGWIFTAQRMTRPGYMENVIVATIELCPLCHRPTFFEDGQAQIPGVPIGESVPHVPNNVSALYDEARRCTASNSFTAAVLATRKLLMHIAVDLGAPQNKNFVEYIEYLANSGYVPPNGKGWVDHIRKKGNEANHEIVQMNAADARDLIAFAEMLLRFIYEFPKRVPVAPSSKPTP